MAKEELKERTVEVLEKITSLEYPPHYNPADTNYFKATYKLPSDAKELLKHLTEAPKISKKAEFVVVEVITTDQLLEMLCNHKS